MLPRSTSAANHSAWAAPARYRPPARSSSPAACSRTVSSIVRRTLSVRDRAREQARVDECLDASIVAPQTASAASRERAAGEDGEPGEHAPLVPGQQIGAPGERVGKRLLARGRVARPGAECRHPVGEPIEQQPWGKRRGPRGRQLDRQRQAVERAGRRRGSRRSSSVPGAAVRSRAAARSTKRRTASSSARGRSANTCSPETCSDPAAGHDHRQMRCLAREPCEFRCGVEDVLEVVDHQQHVAVREPADERRDRRLALRLGDAQRLGDRPRHELRIADRRQLDEGGAVRERGPATRASSSASLDLPLPPAPAIVRSRTSSRATSARRCSSSAPRPRSGVAGSGGGAAGRSARPPAPPGRDPGSGSRGGARAGRRPGSSPSSSRRARWPSR